MATTTDQFKPGMRVSVTQQIPQRDEVWTLAVQGTVVRAEQCKTGSWFAHAKDHKLWLDRLLVRKDDGELVTFNLDPYTHVDVLSGGDSNETGKAATDARAQASERPDRATGFSSSEPDTKATVGNP